MIFFGTLFAAGLLALGEPTGNHGPAGHHAGRANGSAPPAAASWHDGSWHDLATAGHRPR
jgi:hypothetical protein